MYLQAILGAMTLLQGEMYGCQAPLLRQVARLKRKRNLLRVGRFAPPEKPPCIRRNLYLYVPHPAPCKTIIKLRLEPENLFGGAEVGIPSA